MGFERDAYCRRTRSSKSMTVKRVLISTFLLQRCASECREICAGRRAGLRHSHAAASHRMDGTSRIIRRYCGVWWRWNDMVRCLAKVL